MTCWKHVNPLCPEVHESVREQNGQWNLQQISCKIIEREKEKCKKMLRKEQRAIPPMERRTKHASGIYAFLSTERDEIKRKNVMKAKWDPAL